MKTCLIASAVAGALVVVGGLLWMRPGGGALLSAAEWNSRRAGEVPPTLVRPPLRLARRATSARLIVTRMRKC